MTCSQSYPSHQAANSTHRCQTVADGDITTWTYDASYQLLAEHHSGANAFSSTFTYDAVGNRLSKDTGTEITTSTYDAANQLSRAESVSGITTYSYDANGNQEVTETPSGDLTTNTWDYENRMTSIEQPDGSLTTYTYAANNQDDEYLFEKETDTGTAKYVWDNRNILQEYDVATDVQYTYAPQPYGDLISQRRSTDSSYYHYDGNFSAAALTDASAVETDRYQYTAFGKTNVSTGATENPFTWKGKIGYYQDEDSLQMLRNRRYSGEQGRFTSQDPIGLDGGDSNLYRYARNNAVNIVDPSGERLPIDWMTDGNNTFIPPIAPTGPVHNPRDSNETGTFIIPITLPNGKTALVTNSSVVEPWYYHAVIRVTGPKNAAEAREFIEMAWTLASIEAKWVNVSLRIQDLSERAWPWQRKTADRIKANPGSCRKPVDPLSYLPHIPGTGLNSEEVYELAHREIELFNILRLRELLKDRFNRSEFARYQISAESQGTVFSESVDPGSGADVAIESFQIRYSSDESIYATGDEMLFIDILAISRLAVRLTLRRLAAREGACILDDTLEAAGSNLAAREQRLARALDEQLEYYLELEAKTQRRLSEQIQRPGQSLVEQIDEVARRRQLGTDPASGRYRSLEEEAALRLEQRTGRLRRDPSGAGDWIDAACRTYDAVGPVPAKHFDLQSFTRQIDKHLLKQGLDRIVVDVSGLSAKNRADVLQYIQGLSPAQQSRIIVQP